MKNSLMMIAAVLFIGAGAQATEPVMHGHEGKHKCIMFGVEKWQNLGLSEKQQEEVAQIQESCERDY